MSSRFALSKLIPSSCRPTPLWLHGIRWSVMNACLHVASGIANSTLLLCVIETPSVRLTQHVVKVGATNLTSWFSEISTHFIRRVAYYFFSTKFSRSAWSPVEHSEMVPYLCLQLPLDARKLFAHLHSYLHWCERLHHCDRDSQHVRRRHPCRAVHRLYLKAHDQDCSQA